jgi:hypothetical protein
MIGGPSPPSENTMWSHRKNPSNPAASAATPSSISPAGSWPKLGTATPRSSRSVTGSFTARARGWRSYLRKILKPSLRMRAPKAVAAPPMIPLVIVSLCSVPNFRAVAMTGSAAA